MLTPIPLPVAIIGAICLLGLAILVIGGLMHSAGQADEEIERLTNEKDEQ